MSDSAPSGQSALERVLQFMDLMQGVLEADAIEELEGSLLPSLAQLLASSAVFLYVSDPRIPAPVLVERGFSAEAVSVVEKACTELFERISSLTSADAVWTSVPATSEVDIDLAICPVQADQICVGIVGVAGHDDRLLAHAQVWERVRGPLALAISRLVRRVQSEKELSDLNTYQTVSSMLAQSLDLRELLEMALYCCMEAVSAESASVLVLDDEKMNFRFYQVEGPAKPVLMAATFPSDTGLAGSVLHSQRSEVIHDVQSDPRFYGKIDSETGVRTRNMIVVPLSAGEEQIGVLEVLNKADGGSFSESDHLLLVSIAEEIAFAIRNALVFDYVVNTYCLQRQGQSCRGCKRPLDSWTPCVKYREVGI
jgi:GAF domain-containing protein